MLDDMLNEDVDVKKVQGVYLTSPNIILQFLHVMVFH